MAIFLPDACEPVAGSADIGLDLFDVRAALAGGTLLDSEVAETGMHMAVRAPRLAAYIKGLDDDGFFDWTPMPGEARTAFPVMVARLATGLRTLPASKRTLSTSERRWVAQEAPLQAPGVTG